MGGFRRYVRLRPVRRLPVFRRVAIGSWGRPADPTVYGTLRVDAGPILDYVRALRERPGAPRVTVTHVVGRAMACLLAEEPALNALIRWGRIYRRDEVDVFFQVALEGDGSVSGADLSGLVVRRADRKQTVEIAAELAERVVELRRGEDPELEASRRSLARVPGWALRPLMLLLDLFQFGFNLTLPGMPRDPLGSIAVTNVGSLGISEAYAPLYPPSRSPLVVLVGAVRRRPWVAGEGEDERLEIRSVLSLFFTFDHRLLDGLGASKLARRLEAMLADPAALDRGASASRGLTREETTS